VALQSPFAAHWLHCAVVDEQIGAAGAQSVGFWHPTQVPVAASQMGASGMQFAAVVHFGRQLWSKGSQTCPTAQSVEALQPTHPPSTQKGAFGLQSVSAPQVTQPTPARQPCGQGSPPIAQAPPPGPFLLLPQETATTLPAARASAPAASLRQRWMREVREEAWSS
jgi:hypothetical protein